ncbi:hypothetical protein G6735_04795 [Polynucleobacter paneuropaeus]|nr:hypothetical protein [Polynucleobacter paneuropaeus]
MRELLKVYKKLTYAANKFKNFYAFPIQLSKVVIASIIFFGMVMYSGLGEPIWVDEFLHFAFAGFPNTSTAWFWIQSSIGDTNFGQTGIYMLVDYWLLKAFGANVFFLRLPSILSAGFLLTSGIIFFSNRGFSFWWKIILLGSLLSNNYLMQFAGVARPYMPLAASSVGLLAYYSIPISRRNTYTFLFGLTSVFLGVLFHPYIPLYWASIYVFMYLLSVREGISVFSFKSALKFVNLSLLSAGIIGYAVIAGLSWLPRRYPLALDPFHIVKKNNLLSYFGIQHFDFIAAPFLIDNIKIWIILPTLIIGCIFLYLFVPIRSRCKLQSLLPPICLIGICLGLSAFIAYTSYIQQYWIVNRQWVASFALLNVAFIWFFAELARNISWHSRLCSSLIAILLLYISSTCILRLVPIKWAESIPQRGEIATRATLWVGEIPSTQSIDWPIPKDMSEWVAMANENILYGGDVWPFFRKYYTAGQ